MTLIEKLPPFASGVAAAGLACMLFTAVSAQVNPDVIVACADPGGTMRLNDGGPCRPGERRLVLKAADLEDAKPDEKSKDDQKVSDLDRRLKNLEERSLRRRMPGGSVVAPFEVVNEAGKRVFYVQEGSVSAHNANGTVVARIVANENGGSFEGRSVTGSLTAEIGSSRGQVGVVIRENERQRLQLGRNDKGNYGARFYGATGKLVAGIGQSEAGTGIAMVADADGTPKAKMYSLPSGAGLVEIVNGQGIGVASMSSSGPDGAGILQLTNAAGTVMVEAGVTRAGRGVVRAGPAAFNSGIAFLGLPGSYIEGRPAK